MFDLVDNDNIDEFETVIVRLMEEDTNIPTFMEEKKTIIDWTPLHGMHWLLIWPI